MKSLVLGSGLRVIMHPSTSDIVYCGIAIDSGTRDELESESGIAHFTEHLSFKGTERRTSRQIISRMESVGGDLNAFTGKEETVYYCTCQKEHFHRALDLLLDIVQHSTYPQTEIDKEVEVVIDEIESYNDSPSELIYDDFEALLFNGHPLGRNILGQAERLRQYTCDDIRRYADRMYTPQRMVLFIHGNVRLPRLSIPSVPDAVSAPSPRLKPNLPYTPQHVVVDKDTHQAHVMMGARAFGGNDSRHMALYLANNILGGPGLSSRLNLALRERTGLVYTVESSLTTYTDTGVWSVYFGCDHDDVQRCQRLVRKELQRLCDTQLSPRTLEAAKRQLIGQLAISYDNPESVAIGMGKRLLHYNRISTQEDIIRRIQSVTSQDIQQVARDIFDPANLTTLIYR